MTFSKVCTARLNIDKAIKALSLALFQLGSLDIPKRQIKYNDKYGSDLTLIPAGYYRVTSIGDKSNGYYWLFTRESNGLFDKMNTFFNKTSNFDILIVKK